MSIGPRLDVRQSQSLVMTPQLRQAIQLLQFTNVEAAQFLEEEMLRNPLLVREGPASVAPSEVASGVDRDVGPPPADAESVLVPTVPLDTDFSNVYDPGLGSDQAGGQNRFEEEDEDAIGWIAERPASLREHVEQQARLAFRDQADWRIALALIAALEPSGWLAEPPEAIAASLGVALETLEVVRCKMLRFDPTGVFARNLAECLSVQLMEQNRFDPAMAALVGHLELLARRDYRALLAICGVDEADLRDMIAEIRRLDPKPGARFESEPVRALIPDVIIRLGPDGTYIVELNPETMPRVLIRRGFHARMAVGAARETKQFLSENLQAASFLVRALEARAQTILRVASTIVQLQEGLFRAGIAQLRPLTLRDIAEALELHESTISRVTANKSMATPRGIFEMKFFFTASLGGADGESHSASSVRHRIAALIEGEPPGAVLSDEALAKILQKEGIDIARRTVAKYREAMRIPGSAQRRRDKGLMG
ncbi:MAG TPA: RNA polymerase factor sigma-54 [Acidiphilium sp.]|nr:MAG: RNA polymerase sigma-54 factor [Acidiphilium sp. 21-60-14]OYV91801.1 MAG: RNA polymerase sigma-54 factor [Acidiphilium sp. 37-60-79]HQT89231.1 RNA polymerase factor sigma-54 [Acidiphilium sp.]HQU24302.1 RNA polymerase factor sigma-54 [Acidiphilium sp.]